MAAILYPLFTVALLWLFFRLWKLRKSSEKRLVGVLILQVVIFSLIYNNLVISVGSLLGEGNLLQSLSLVRFLLHATFTPLLMVTAMEFAVRVEVRWVQSRLSRIVIWLAAVSLMGFGVVVEWLLTGDLGLEAFLGTLRYEHLHGFPPFPAFLTILVVTILGVLIWRTLKWPWVLIGGIVMFVGSVIPSDLVGPVVEAGVEVLWIGSLVATEQRLLTPDYSLSEGELESRISQVAAGRSKKP